MPNLLEIQPEPHISNLLRSRIDAGDFPSAVYVVAENGKVVFADGLGDAVREPEVHPASLDTVYDLASLTKPLVTGLLSARRVESGELTLDSAAAQYLPEFDLAICLRTLQACAPGGRFISWRVNAKARSRRSPTNRLNTSLASELFTAISDSSPLAACSKSLPARL